ncbi:hybrid sensor histidine kinase/response regulator transcription factor [Echinicola shivajiensis]|uniref:hybrid sensor histidine kinase/response regulator transcription factor n=1 Tax=Echinicola shivajiensis TaxID=1035916 RepID=UPI001BFC14FB|nr:two-component regulator propeller domain-containing protein [Echinicola shivajiensis]
MTSYIIRCLLCAILALSSLRLLAQSAIDHITTEDGLLNNYVTCIYQDQEGFIWIGTKEGASRFNGLDFMHFTHNPSDSLSLSSSMVLDITQDRKGNIWMATNEGLNLLKSGSNKIHQIKFESTKPKGNHISKLFIDSSDQIWVGTGSGELYRYQEGKYAFEHFPTSGMAEVRDIIQTEDQKLLIGYGAWVLRNKKGGMAIFDMVSKTYQSPEKEFIPNDFSVTQLLKSEDKIIISTYNKGGYLLNLGNEQLEKINTQAAHTDLIYHMVEKADGTILLGTDGDGISEFDIKKGQIHSIAENKALNSQAITYLLEDKNQIIWVGTVNGGLSKIDPHKSKIDHWAFTNDPNSGLSGKSVLSLSYSKNRGIWLGLDHGGLNYYHLGSKQFKHFPTASPTKQSPADHVINGLMEDSKGNLWLGYYLNGLGRLKQGEKNFEHYLKDNWMYGATYVKAFYEEEDGSLWFGTRNQGLIQVDKNFNFSTNYKHHPNNAHSLPHNHVTTIMEKDQNHLWVGTFDGLGLLDKRSGKFKNYQNQPNDPKSLMGTLVYSICKDSLGNLWVATDKSLNYLDVKTEKFTSYNVSHGLPSNTIKGIILDDHQELWVSTNRGISHFEPKTNSFINYGYQDGIQGIEFNENAVLKDPSGKLYFGSVNGVTSFHPDNIKRNKIPPRVYLSQLYIANSPINMGDETGILDSAFSQTHHITLNYDQADFTIEFIALNFTSPEKNQYAYMLEGFDKTWNNIGNERKAIYTNIDPGDYTFLVKAANNDGVWNETAKTLSITILPPWWKTWWAYTLYLLLILGAIYGISRASLHRMRLLNALKMEILEKQQQKALSKLKISFFTNISHEFKTPLTLISGPAQSLGMLNNLPSEGKYYTKLIQSNAKRLQVLVNQLMDFRKAEEGEVTLNKKQTELVGFLDACLDNFCFLADQQEVNVSKDYEIDCLFIDVDQNKLDIILYNILSNAFKFTPKGGKVILGFKVLKEEVKIFVKDTGIGIPPEDLENIFEPFYQSTHDLPGTGLGLPLSKSYMQLHDGRIEVDSTLHVGSDFSLFFPYRPSFEKNSIDAKSKLIDRKVQGQNEPKNLMDLGKVAEKVLIIEDDPQMQSFILSCFTPWYQTKVASDGEVGKNIAEEWQPDLIISDVMMPKMDGISMVKLLKDNFMTSHIPVILLTAKADEEDVQKGLLSGADDYIPKPFNPSILVTKVKSLISIRKNLQGIYGKSSSIEPEKLGLKEVDKEFINKINLALSENHKDPEFDINQLAETMGLSRSQLFRKIKGITGETPHSYLQSYRLNLAKELLLNSGLNISGVAYELGFGTDKGFRTAFKKQFNCTPSEYLNRYFKS